MSRNGLKKKKKIEREGEKKESILNAQYTRRITFVEKFKDVLHYFRGEEATFWQWVCVRKKTINFQGNLGIMMIP